MAMNDINDKVDDSQVDRAEGAGDKDRRRGPIVIEASWAPKDPRDRLYDDTASSKEKAQSAARIIASFHPVLNVCVLAFDSTRRFGLVKTLIFIAAILVAFYELLAGQAS
jgi:hypothetical protein